MVLGIGDDAALLEAPAGWLVATCDALLAGRHFAPEDDPADVGWKALAVNLSDLAAMGARPRHALLALNLPEADGEWLERFLDGFLAIAHEHGVALVGGNLARGDLSITVTLLGEVAAGRALRRDGGRAGDRLWVTGALGAAAAALASLRRGERPPPDWRARLDRPVPRVSAGLALAGLAHAAIDLSDGLLADLDRLCTASGTGAEIDLSALPFAPGLEALGDDDRLAFALGGGEDYELLLALPPGLDPRPQLADSLPITAIGTLTAEPGIRLRDARGALRPVGAMGFDHFAGDGDA